MSRPVSICVIGLGYIGLPTAAVLASSGYQVHGVDINQGVVDTINEGRIHIVEPDLDAFVRSAVAAGRLRAGLTAQVSDVYLICVPTPFHEGDGVPTPNIDFVLEAASSIANLVKEGDIVVLESTSPVGTTEKVAGLLANRGVDVTKVNIAYCPERVLPGKIMTELVGNDRIVGGLTKNAAAVVAEFYRSFVRGAVLETDARTAEMCKLTENSFRDINIAFANELSIVCANEGIDIWELIKLANHHPRVNILHPGAGVGGHCIAVDPWFIVSRNPQQARLIRTAREVNIYKTAWVIEEIKRAVDAAAKATDSSTPVIACLGMAFKPDIDDLRESPAAKIVKKLQDEGYDVVVVEPNIDICPDVKLVTVEEALIEADVVAVLVKHRQFCALDVRQALVGKGALDFCGAFS